MNKRQLFKLRSQNCLPANVSPRILSYNVRAYYSSLKLSRYLSTLPKKFLSQMAFFFNLATLLVYVALQSKLCSNSAHQFLNSKFARSPPRQKILVLGVRLTIDSQKQN